MNYYRTNAVYERLKNIDRNPFIWVSGNAWTLVYGDQNSVPAVFAIVAGYSWQRQSDVIALARRMAEVSGLPWIEIYFDDTVPEISTVELSVGGGESRILTLAALKEEFGALGLPTSTGGATKAINDASSSAYHNWQRSSLGRITVSDIDLFRRSSSSCPAEIIELKRSYIPLNDWRPFQEDYRNFNLLLNVSTLCGVGMSIAYNLRKKSPFYDDASELSMFSYAKENGPVLLGRVSFAEFLEGAYLK